MSRSNIVLPMCLLATLLLYVPVATRADHWTRFRGPNGTGVAADRNVPVQFDEKSNVLWKVAVPGNGNSSPVVWGNRLFLQTATQKGKERQLLCLDAATGKQLWARSLPGVTVKIRGDSSLASATPAVDGERVYVSFWDGTDVILAAYDLDGGKVWDRNFGEFTSQHGAGASPIAYQGKVFFANDQDGTSTLYALDAKTGKTVWQADRPAYRACYSAPFLLEKTGQPTELVVLSTMALTGYDPHKGTTLWNWTWKFAGKMPLRTVASPIYHDGLLFACSGDGGGDRHMVAVSLTGAGTETKAEKVWENRKDFPYVPTPLVRGDHIYFVNDKGMAGCYEAKTGKKVWFERLPGVKEVYASQLLIDGKIYAATNTGEVFVIAAEPTFQLLAHNVLGEVVRATPAVANDRLYVRGQQHLFCIGKK